MMIPKFRAWDKSRKLMGDVTSIKFSEVQHMQVKYRINDNGKAIDEWSNLDDDGCGTCVLMQSTGLKDKNGVEIFEGDIVKVLGTIEGLEDDLGVVRFVDAVFVIDYDNLNSEFDYFNTVSLPVKVIGKIYETPELLEAK